MWKDVYFVRSTTAIPSRERERKEWIWSTVKAKAIPHTVKKGLL